MQYLSRYFYAVLAIIFMPLLLTGCPLVPPLGGSSPLSVGPTPSASGGSNPPAGGGNASPNPGASSAVATCGFLREVGAVGRRQPQSTCADGLTAPAGLPPTVYTAVTDTNSPCLSTTIPPNLQSIDQKYGALIEADVAGTGLPKLYIEAEIMQESGGDPMDNGDNNNSRGLLQLNVNNSGFQQAYPNFVQPPVGDSSDPRYNPAINLKIAISEFDHWLQVSKGDLQLTSLNYETGGMPQNTVPNYDTDVQNICAGH